MKPGNGIVALAWRQLRRDLAAGDVRILIAALVLAVLAVTAVGLVLVLAPFVLAGPYGTIGGAVPFSSGWWCSAC